MEHGPMRRSATDYRTQPCLFLCPQPMSAETLFSLYLHLQQSIVQERYATDQGDDSRPCRLITSHLPQTIRTPSLSAEQFQYPGHPLTLLSKP